VMCDGRRLTPSPPLEDVRQAFTRTLEALPTGLRRLESAEPYSVRIGPALRDLASKVAGA
jgi:hypothetical protein